MPYKTTLVTEDGIAVFIEVVKPDQAANLLTDCAADAVSRYRNISAEKKKGSKEFPSEENLDEEISTDLTNLFAGIVPTSDSGSTLPTNEDDSKDPPTLYEVGFPVYVPNVTKVARTITLNRPSTATISLNAVNLISRLRKIDDKLMKSVSSTARIPIDYDNIEATVKAENAPIELDIRNIELSSDPEELPNLDYINTLYGGYFDSYDGSIAAQFIDAVYNIPTRDGSQSSLIAGLIPELSYLARYAKLNTKKGDNLTSAFLDLYKRTKFNPFVSDIYRVWIFVKSPPETSKHMARWTPYFGGYISNISTSYNAKTASWDVELSCEGTSSKLEESQVKTHYTVVNWIGKYGKDSDGSKEVLHIIQDASIRMSGAQSGAALQSMFSNKSLAGLLHAGIQLTNNSRTYLGALGIYRYAHNEYLQKSDKDITGYKGTTDGAESADDEMANSSQNLIGDYWDSVAEKLNIPREAYFYYDYFYLPHRSDNTLTDSGLNDTIMYRMDVDTDNYDDKDGMYPRYSPYIPSDYIDKETNKSNKAYAVKKSPWVYDYDGSNLNYPALHWEVEFLKSVQDVELAAKAWWFGIQDSSTTTEDTDPDEDVEGGSTPEDYDGERDIDEEVQEESVDTDNEEGSVYYYLKLPIRERWVPKIMLDNIIWKDPIFAMVLRKEFALDDMGDRKTFLAILKEACAKVGCSFYDDPFGNLIVIQNRYDDLPYIYNPLSIRTTKDTVGSGFTPTEVDITFPGYCPFDNLDFLKDTESQESEEGEDDNPQGGGEGDSDEDVEGYEAAGEDIEDEDGTKGFLDTDGSVITGLATKAKDTTSKDTFSEGVKKRTTYTYEDLPKFLLKDHDNKYVIGKDHFTSFNTTLDPSAVYTFAKGRTELDFISFSGVLDLLYRTGFGGTSVDTQLKYGVRVLDNIPSMLSTPNTAAGGGQTEKQLMEIFASSMLRVENAKSYSGTIKLNWQTLTMQPGRNIFVSPLCQKGYVLKVHDTYDVKGSATGDVTVMGMVDIGKILGNPYIEYQARNDAWRDTFDAYEEAPIDFVNIRELETAEEKAEWLQDNLDHPEYVCFNDPEAAIAGIKVLDEERLEEVEQSLVDLTGNNNYDISAIADMADAKHSYAREGSGKVTPQLTTSAKDRLDKLLEAIRLWVIRNYGEVDEDGNEDDSLIRITIDSDKFKLPIQLTHSPVGHTIDFSGTGYKSTEDGAEWADSEANVSVVESFKLPDTNGYLDLTKDFGHWSASAIKLNMRDMTERDDGTEPTYMVFKRQVKAKTEEGEEYWDEENEETLYLPKDILYQVINYQDYTEDDNVDGVTAISPYWDEYVSASYLLGHLVLSKYVDIPTVTEEDYIEGSVGGTKGAMGFGSSNRSVGDITKIVIHYTAGCNISGAEAALQEAGLSYHFMIDKSGGVYQYVDIKDVAYHAGSEFQESYGYYCNQESIGISLVGGHDNCPGFPKEQIAALQGLLYRLCNHYNIEKKYPTKLQDGFEWDMPDGMGADYYRKKYSKISEFNGIVGHQTVNPGKPDPGPKFDYKQIISGLS